MSYRPLPRNDTLTSLKVTSTKDVSGGNTIAPLHVLGGAIIDKQLKVKEQFTALGTAQFDGNVTVDGTIKLNGLIIGSIILTGSLDVDDNLTVGQTTTLNGETSINDTLTVTDAASFGSTSAFSGIATFSENVVIDSGKSLTVPTINNTTANIGTLVATNNATFDALITTDSLAVTNDATVSGDLTVTGSISAGSGPSSCGS